MKKFNVYSKILAAALCAAVALGGMAGFKADSVKAQEPAALAAPEKEADAATQDAVEFTIKGGDWDMDGTVTLQDARNVLRASLNLIEADSVHKYMFDDVYGKSGITLQSAQNTLRIALNLSQGSVIKRTRPEVVYEMIKERSSEDDYFRDDLYELFETKEELQKWAMDNRLPEMSQAAAAVSEEQLKDRWLVIVRTPVYTKDINDVQIKEIYTELRDYAPDSIYINMTKMLAIMEENASVLDEENYVYLSINLLPKYMEANSAIIQCDKTLTGRQEAAVHRYIAWKIWKRTSPDTVVLRSGEDSVSYRDALLKDIPRPTVPDLEGNLSEDTALSDYYPEGLISELTKDESFYEKYTQIVYRVNEVYSPERQMLSWIADGENMNVSLKTENWTSHVEKPTGAIGDTYFVITMENSLLQGKTPVLHFEKNTVYTDFEPEQEQFSFGGAVAKNDYGMAGCTNDEQRQEFLTGLAEVLSDNEEPDKQRLFDAIQSVDLEKKDVIVTFTKNKQYNGENGSVYVNPKKVYLSLKGTRLHENYDNGGEQVEGRRQIITVCTVEKGRLGNVVDAMSHYPSFIIYN